MERFLPKNKKHTLRSILLSVGILCISAGIAFGAQKHLSMAKPVSVVQEPHITQTEKTQPDNSAQIAQEIISPALAAPKEPAPAAVPVVAVPPAPAVRSKVPTTLLEEAKMYTQPQILTGKYIDVSLKYQNMVIFEDGKALDAYMVSSGMRGHLTPLGTFKIENKSPKAWSKSYGLWMPYWMAFLPDGEMGIHELPIWPGGYQEGASHLGTPVSHGCVRLGVGPAHRVYDWADIGTPVVIHQ